jgi:hypothetical protein
MVGAPDEIPSRETLPETTHKEINMLFPSASRNLSDRKRPLAD